MQRSWERTWVSGSAAARIYGRSDGRQRYGLDFWTGVLKHVEVTIV